MSLVPRRFRLRPKGLIAILLATACGEALAQPLPATPSAVEPAPAVSMEPVPYSVLASSLSADEVARLRQALRAARSGDTATATSLQAGFSNPIASRLVEWAMIDAAGSKLDYFTLAKAQRDLDGWPRPARLRASLERSLDAAALPPQQVVDLFQGRDPETAEGAMALAAAYKALGRQADAQALIKHVWRNHGFDAAAQQRMLERFGTYLTPEDHAARLEMLLYGSEGASIRGLLPLVSEDQRAIADARTAFRTDRSDAQTYFLQVPTALQNDPGLAFDRARYFRRHNLDVMAAGLVRYFPAATPEQPDVTAAVWDERRALMFAALQSGDYAGAYAAAANAGLQPGADCNEAEFFAGWLALTKLKNPDLAESHFAKLQAGGETPITLSRAAYWRGRAAETKGDVLQARLFWADGAKYSTAFYGQLSAAKLGQQTLSLGVDPAISEADRAVFERRGIIQAARMLGDTGERELFTTFVMGAEETSQTATDLALLVDMVRMYGDQALAMRIVRAGAQRGLYLPDRGYPVHTLPPGGYGAPEPALVFAITRQESGFDPSARSGAGARGMMQLMPTTAAIVARRAGLGYSPARLDEADYNMQLGSAYLGQLVDDFSGSYVLATAAYNAGPGRPRAWVTTCGDPRQGGDPADFIECIPISETRNYVMRVMENVEVYRARLNGGSAPLMIASDLKRGGWTPPASVLPGHAAAPTLLGQAAPAPPAQPVPVSTQAAAQPTTVAFGNLVR